MQSHERIDEFPVEWDKPVDAERTWIHDPMHTPDVVPPLGFDLGTKLKFVGFNQALEELGLPSSETEFRRINCYQYSARGTGSMTTTFMNLSHQEKLARLKSAPDRWQNEILPRVKELTDYYLNTDFEAMSNDSLLQELNSMREVKVEDGRLHHLSTQPWQVMVNMFLDTYSEITGGTDLEGIRLLQGYGNKSVDAGHAMWELAKLARTVPSVKNELAHINSASVVDAMNRIKQDQTAQSFIEALDSFLDEYGWRNDLLGFEEPTWREDPTIALVQLRRYLEMDESYDPVSELTRLAEERDKAIEKTREGLSPAEWRKIAEILDVATPYASILEDHNFYIDQRLTTAPRRLFLAIGHRLVSANLIAEAEEVFYLFYDEVCSALRGESGNYHSVVNERKEEMAYWSQRIPPGQVGKPGSRELNPRLRRTFGAHGLVSDQPNQLPGNPGSAGSATGPARVLLSLDEAERLNKGDILIARTTMPPWTPLFAVASAIVVETGGVLSHAAITAREYGIPAVLGVRDATRIIRDGQLVEVNGDEGQVRIIG